MLFSFRGAAFLCLLVACVNRTEIAQNGDAGVLPDGAVPDTGTPDSASAFDAASRPDAPDPSGQWARSFGGGQSDRPTDVALDAEGNVYVTGSLSGPAIVGSVTVPAGIRAAFVASYSSDGLFRWVESLGASSIELGYKAHVVVQGEQVAIAMDFNGVASRDDGTLTSAGESDILVASFTTDGALRWWRREGDVNEDRVTDLAIDSVGNLYVTGYFHNETQIGAETLTGMRGAGFVTSLDMSGTVRWAQAPGAGTSGPIAGLASQGESLVLFGGFGGFGEVQPDFDIAGTTLSGEFGDTYLFSLGMDGEERWARQGSSGGSMEVHQMVTASTGETYVAAGLRGFATLGERRIEPSGSYDAVIMAFDENGADLWARAFGSEGISPIDRATGITLAGTNVAITGQFAGAIDLGGGLHDPTPSMSRHNSFVLLLDAAGEHVWSMAFDNRAQDGQVSRVAANSAGHLFVVAPFTRTPTFGPFMLESAGFEDGALLRLHPAF